MKVDKDLLSFQDEIDNAIEQQKEVEATVSVTDNIASLNSIAATIHDDAGKLESLVGKVKDASTIHLSDQNKTDMEQCGRAIATAAANEFNKLVEVNVEKLKNVSDCVTIPATAAYFLITTFVLLVLFFVLTIFANEMFIHSERIETLMWSTAGIWIYLIATIGFTRYKEWW